MNKHTQFPFGPPKRAVGDQRTKCGSGKKDRVSEAREPLLKDQAFKIRETKTSLELQKPQACKVVRLLPESGYVAPSGESRCFVIY